MADLGRPSKYTDKLAAELCSRVAAGETVVSVCKSDHMPCIASIFKWLGERPAFSESYARAKETRLEVMAEELNAIADDSVNDYVDRLNFNGSTPERVVDAEHINRSRLRIDTRKWLLARLASKTYGDKLAVEATGKDGGPIQSEHRIVFVEPEKKNG